MYPNVLWGPKTICLKMCPRTCINTVQRVSRGFWGIFVPEGPVWVEIYLWRWIWKNGFFDRFWKSSAEENVPKMDAFSYFWPTEKYPDWKIELKGPKNRPPVSATKPWYLDPTPTLGSSIGSKMVFSGGAILGTFSSAKRKKSKKWLFWKNPKFF